VPPLVSGRVTAAGAPVAGARVMFVRAPVALPDVAQVSGPTGQFALNAPTPGRYAVAAYAGRAAGELQVDVGATDVIELVLSLREPSSD